MYFKGWCDIVDGILGRMNNTCHISVAVSSLFMIYTVCVYICIG